jgi:Spy/CpxP family protein refolding chaperone
MKILIAACALAVAVLAPPALAQDNAAAVAELMAMQKAARADKRGLTASTLKLTEAEAKKFWPIYDTLQRDLVRLNRERNLALETLAARDRPLSDAYAKQVVNDLLSIEEQEIKALRKASNASPARAAPEEGRALHAAREQAARGAGLRDRCRFSARAVSSVPVKPPACRACLRRAGPRPHWARARRSRGCSRD